jgi:hypothetical protein
VRAGLLSSYRTRPRILSMQDFDNEADECRHRHGDDWYNLFPLRRWCHNRAFPVGQDRTVLTGVFGDPFSDASAYSLRTFTLTLSVRLSESNNNDDNNRVTCEYSSALDCVPGNATLLVPRTVPPAVFSGFGYLSNLYEDNYLIGNRVWTHVQFRSDAFVRDNRTVLLQRATFVDEVEGVANAYFANRTWHFHDCTTAYGGAYAFWDASSEQPGCACQAFHQPHPISGVCVPACPAGLIGAQRCTTPSVFGENCPYRVNSRTLFQRSDTCEPVCQRQFTLGAVECVEELVDERATTSTDTATTASAHTAPSTPLTITAIVVLALAACVVTALAVRIVWAALGRHMAPAREIISAAQPKPRTTTTITSAGRIASKKR